MSKKVECPDCGELYKKLGSHWVGSPDHRPDFTEKQCNIITGLMMGDGSINMKEKGNPRMKVKMISRNYLEYLDEIFGILSTGVRLATTAKESAENMRKTGFSPDASEENYSDKYVWRTRNHPDLSKWDWYTGANRKKEFPSDIDLTPTVLKHWFCGDGSITQGKGRPRITISCSNERYNEEKIDSMFDKKDLPKPSRYVYHEYKEYRDGMYIWFDVDKSEELWEYMGSPLPDFEYKWHEIYRSD